MEENPKLAAYFSGAKRWQPELAALRRLALDAGLAETFKWRGPCYTHAGGNIAFLGALKDCVAVGFFKGVLLDDPAGILVPSGEYSRIARVFKASSLAEIDRHAGALTACLTQAMRLEEEGAKVDLSQDEIDLPEELIAAMEGDPELAEAFGALTPGRQRGWAMTFAQPKQAATRIARIVKARPRILAGKGIHDR